VSLAEKCIPQIPDPLTSPWTEGWFCCHYICRQRRRVKI